jgi:hypothetical protein
MQRRTRTLGFVALLFTAAILAFAPVLSSRYSIGDVPFLVRASPIASSDSAHVASRLTEGDGPLARWSLALTGHLWAHAGRWTAAAARAIRIENLLLLLGTAALLRLTLRRALSPWAGADGARAAAGACALFVVCHPLGVPAVAAAGARGDLLAACLGTAAAALFLRGRQEKRLPEMAAAGAAALLAGHASALALLLPPLLFVLELFSARRHRPLHVRLRTAATTLIVFGACVSAEALTGPFLGSAALLQRTLAAISATFASQGVEGIARSLAARLGAIAMPVTTSASLTDGVPFLYLLSGALLLVALQPALVAARSAPRLWGWLAALAGTGILCATLLGSSTSPIGEAVLFFPGVWIACAGLAVASTALSGLRRVLVPAALTALFIVLARQAAGPIEAAGAELGVLQASLDSARSQHAEAATYLAVDLFPAAAGEREPSAASLLLDPSISPHGNREHAVAVRGISRDALLALSRQPEFAEMRRQSVVIVRPPLEPGGLPGISSLSSPQPSSGVLTWQGDLRSELFDIDPLEKRALRAVAISPVSTADAPRMGWRAGESEKNSRAGIWIEGATGPVAFFDLSGSPEWLFGPRARRVWLGSDAGKIALGELLADVPSIPGRIEPDARTEGWRFAIPSAALPRPLHGETRFVLSLLELESLRYLELPPRTSPKNAGSGEMVLDFDFPPAREGRFGRSPLAWSLEWRCGDVCLSRASGRR